MANKGMKGLLVWCKKHTEGYRDVNITNMTSSWSSGLGFCALLHRFRPDLIDFESLSKENAFYNNQLAFEIAEKELGIAALLDAEDMANMSVPDRLSVMTYLSQYYSCFRHCKPEENTAPPDVPVNNPKATASPAKESSPARRSTDDSICCICGKRVHLVQRYFDEGKLYHRTCHRNDSLEKIKGKNYFVKQEAEATPPNRNVNDEEKVKAIVKQEVNEEQEDARDVTRHPDTLEKDGRLKPNQVQELPTLVQSLADAKVKTIDMSATTPSPTSESKPPPNNPEYGIAPSLVSELPVPRHKESPDKIIPEKPKPRARTLHSNEEKNNVPVPVARPRSKDVDNDSKQIQESKSSYNKSLNPFELDSGSDSDTTLSSTSSEDEGNPFAISTKAPSRADDIPQNGDMKVQPSEVIEDENSTDEGGNPFGDPDESPNEESDNGGNPFGDVEEEEPSENQDNSVNSFTKNVDKDSSKMDDKMGKKKKRLAPAPPKGAPAVPIVVQQKPSPSPHKKATAPPRPTGWKEASSQKMVEMNKANEKDPRYTKNANKPQSPSKDKAKHKSPKTRSAPGYGYPLVKRKVEIKMSEQEIANELKLLDVQLTDYETKGVKLEEMLRFAMDSDAEWTSEEDELLQEWFELVNKKNQLLRQESDLVFQMQQQKHEQEHADIEFQLRKLFNKPESTKTDQDKIDEENLLQKLLEVVERRNVIVNSIEEERLKEAEEDSAYEKMKRLQQNPSKKKKKNKVKKMFSKKGKKEKEQAAVPKTK